MTSATAEKTALPSRDTELHAAVMNISASVFTGDIPDNRGIAYISTVNELLGIIGPFVYDNNGYFASVSESGILAVFENDCEHAANCAVTICQTAGLQKSSSKSLEGISIGISFGPVCLSTASFGTFSIPFAVSYCTHLSESLSKAAPKYGSQILIAESAASRIHNFNGRYNIRRLGMCCVKNGSREENIYDVYDGDETDLKYSKRRSKLFFERGVDLFLKGKYLQARSNFIELLKFDRYDSASKQYVYLCDSCIADEADDLSKKYIEIW